MYALIANSAVIEIEAKSFEVASPLKWVDITNISPVPATGWHYDGTSFSAPVPPSAPAVDWPMLARDALDVSDTTILRCYENAVVVPSAWATYRATLRSIVAGASVTALPTRPAYPPGT